MQLYLQWFKAYGKKQGLLTTVKPPTLGGRHDYPTKVAAYNAANKLALVHLATGVAVSPTLDVVLNRVDPVGSEVRSHENVESS